MRQRSSKASSLQPWTHSRFFGWLLVGASVALSAAGCFGQILGNDVEYVLIGADGSVSRRPPVRRNEDGAPPSPDDDAPTADEPTGEPAKVYYSHVFNGLFKEFCTKCHTANGGRSRMDSYSDITHALIAKKATPVEYWKYAWERVKASQMPPVKPDASDEKSRLADGIALFERWAKAGFPPDPGYKPPSETHKGKEDPRTLFPKTATCKGVTPMPARLWRLTGQQLRYSLQDVFGSSLSLPDFSLSQKRLGGLSNSASDSGLDNVDVTHLVKKYEEVSKEVLAKTARWKSCLAKAGDSACVKQLIALDGKRLWRRPPTQAESDKLLKGYQTLVKDSREVALSYVLERMLLSTHFLFRSELGQDEPGKPGVKRLSSHEVATFLSFTLWQSVPDADLMKAADEDKLQTPDQVRAQIQRMLQDPKAARGLTEFLADWLHIRDLLTQEKDAGVFKGLTPQMRQDAVTSALKFLEHVLWKQQGKIADIFTSDTGFLNEALSKLYGGVTVKGTDFKEVKLDASRRTGILTTPAFLMAHAGKDTTGFVHRGVFFLEQLLCSPVGDPPMGAVASGLARVAKADTSKMTQREIMEKVHSADPSCNSCHRKIDPIGAAFEIFSPLGVYRTQEKGKTIDPSGKLEGFGDMKPAFKSSVELIRNAAQSEHFRQCFSLKLYTHLWGRIPEGDRNCALATMYEHLKGKGFQLLQVHQALLDNGQFFLRADPKEQKGG